MMIGIERRTSTHIHVNVQASPIRVGTLFGFAAEGMRLAVQQGQTGFLPMVYDDNIESDILNKFLFNSKRCLAASGVDYVENSLLPLVIPRGAAHRPSMLQDVGAGRRTEIDYLNGAAVRLGHAHGIATPCNDVISHLIRASESGLVCDLR